MLQIWVKNMKENITYKQAVQELEEIHQKIEEGEVELELLTQYTQRAKELVALCQNKLKMVEEILQKETQKS